MPASELGLYNIACRALGERTVASTSEARETRRMLSDVFAQGNGARTYFLEQGLWNFAMRESSSTASSTGNFNFAQRHVKPTDFVRLSAISADQNFSVPLLRYEFQSSNIWADDLTIYLRYVSNSSTAGLNYDLWPDSFTHWAGHWLAAQLAPRLKNDLDMEKLEKRTTKLLGVARSNDAQQEPTRFPPLGSWVIARRGGYGRSDGGNRGSLTG